MSRRQRRGMETAPESVSRTPRPGHRAQPRASLPDGMRSAWPVGSAVAAEPDEKQTRDVMEIVTREPSTETGGEDSGAEWAAAALGAGHESQGTGDLKLCPRKPGPFSQRPAPPSPALGSGQRGIPGTCAQTDRWRGRAGKSVPPRSLAKGASSSWPPGVFLQRQDAARPGPSQSLLPL